MFIRQRSAYAAALSLLRMPLWVCTSAGATRYGCIVQAYRWCGMSDATCIVPPTIWKSSKSDSSSLLAVAVGLLALVVVLLVTISTSATGSSSSPSTSITSSVTLASPNFLGSNSSLISTPLTVILRRLAGSATVASGEGVSMIRLPPVMRG